MKSAIRILMCPPRNYDVDYVINPWMVGNLHQVNPDRAQTQWQDLVNLLQQQATLEWLTPQTGLPDLVFTANGGLVVGQSDVGYHAALDWGRQHDPCRGEISLCGY